MTFDEGYRDAQKSISDGDTSVGKATWIQHDGIDAFISCCLDSVDDAAFMVGLESGHFKAELGTTLFDRSFDLW